jgi:hypothetical protein
MNTSDLAVDIMDIVLHEVVSDPTLFSHNAYFDGLKSIAALIDAHRVEKDSGELE